MTPYGKVLQRMDLGLAALPYWEYIHPMALLFYLAGLSITFASMMMECTVSGVPCNIIIYIDEITPGNPCGPRRRGRCRPFIGQ